MSFYWFAFDIWYGATFPPYDNKIEVSSVSIKMPPDWAVDKLLDQALISIMGITCGTG